MLCSNIQAKVLDKIVAIVFDEIILKSDIDKIKGFEEKYVLERLIEQKILLNEAKQSGISPSARQIEDYINNIKIENGWEDDIEFEKYLKLEGLSLFDLREQIRLDIIINKVKQKILSNAPIATEDKIREYYNTKYTGEKEGDKVLLAHILLDKDKKSINVADAIILDYRAGVSFDDLASKYSKDSLTKSSGGDLGYLEVDQLLPQFKDAISKLEAGDIVGPILTSSGYHILILKEYKKAGLSKGSDIWNKIQRILMEDLRDKFYSNWLKRQRAAAYIEILEPNYNNSKN